MEKPVYQLRLELDLEETTEVVTTMGGGAISAEEARVREEAARGRFEGLGGERPGWYEEYAKLREGGWPWRVACYMAWAASPRRGRQPDTAEDLARDVLGLSGPRAIYTWRRRNPAIDETVALLQAAPLFKHRADILDALVDSAVNEGYRGFHDRRLALEMLGDYTPKSKLEVGKAGKGLEGLSEEELRDLAGTLTADEADDADDAD